MVGHILSSVLFVGFTLLCANSYAQYDPSNASGPNQQPEVIKDNSSYDNTSGERSSSHYADQKEDKEYSSNKRDDLNTAKDVITPHMEVQKSESKPVEKKEEKKTETSSGDDSVLSFNFLYYMIQKFKFSGVME